MDLIHAIIAYEEEGLGDLEALKLFQALVNDGSAWSLQGHYGRTAAALLERGLITPAGEPDPDHGELLAELEN